MRFTSLFSRISNRIEEHGQLRSIITNAGWLFIDKILRMGVGLVIGIWLARYLGVPDFGHLNYAIAFASLFSAIATLGLNGIVVRDLVRHPEQQKEILGSAFSLKLAAGCVTLILTLSAIWLLRPDDTLTHWLVGIIAAGMVFQAFDFIDLWFQSQVKSKFTVYAKSFAFLALSLVKVVLILNGASLIAFAWTGLAEVVIGTIGLTFAFLSTGNSFTGLKPRRQVALKLLGESWPLMLSGLAIMFYMRIDQVMLGEISGEQEVGLYSAALRLSEAWYIIPAVIISSIMPSLTRAHANPGEEYYRKLQKLFSLLARIAYLVALPMTLIATPLVTLLFGEQYSAAGPILSVHIWAALFVFLGVGMSPWILNEGLTRFSLFQAMAGAIVNVLLNLYLIPLYGGLGAAFSTLLSQMVATYFALALFKRTRKIFLIETRAILLR